MLDVEHCMDFQSCKSIDWLRKRHAELTFGYFKTRHEIASRIVHLLQDSRALHLTRHPHSTIQPDDGAI